MYTLAVVALSILLLYINHDVLRFIGVHLETKYTLRRRVCLDRFLVYQLPYISLNK